MADQYCIEKVIQFSHCSVKDFLTSTRLADTSDIISRRYRISMTPSHTLAAQACLGILLYLDKEVRGCVAKCGGWDETLFRPSKPHLTVCIWIHDPAQLFEPLLTSGDPYYYCWQLDQQVKYERPSRLPGTP